MKRGLTHPARASRSKRMIGGPQRLHLTQHRAGESFNNQSRLCVPHFGFDSTVDLFGEHSVQVMVSATQALLEAALVLTLAALLVLLAVRLAQRSASGPVLASIVPADAGRMASPGRDVDIPSALWLISSLPARPPPPCDPGSLPMSRRDRQRSGSFPTGVLIAPGAGELGAQVLRA